MGYISHHAIIVTSDEKTIERLRDKALTIFHHAQVSSVLYSPVNTYCTLFIAPDGSKEGWGDSEMGDKQRAEFLAYIGDKNVVEVLYGGDTDEPKITYFQY